jgi:hypothetical protein
MNNRTDFFKATGLALLGLRWGALRFRRTDRVRNLTENELIWTKPSRSSLTFRQLRFGEKQ